MAIYEQNLPTLLFLDIAITEKILFPMDYAISTKVLLTPIIMVAVFMVETALTIAIASLIIPKKEEKVENNLEVNKIEEKNEEKIKDEDLIDELRKEKERLVQEGLFIDNSFRIKQLKKCN